MDKTINRMREYYKQISDRMCDFEKYYDWVAEMVPDNCRICEVGIADGYSAIMLAEKILTLGKDIERFVLVDSLDYGGFRQAQTVINHIIKSELKCFDFIQQGSLDASCNFPDGYFHHVFIDASHTYEPTKADCRLWYRKVLDEYWMAGHDANTEEVKEAIREVIPVESLEILTTEKDLGVWKVQKNESLKLR